MKRSRILGLLLLTTLVLLCGCARKEPSAEEINSAFTKTIHDFEGYRVENLDEDEGNNFVVYQKGVQEIVMTDNTNVLLEADEENRLYRFENADEALLALEQGDVFFANAPDGLSAIAVKVDSMDLSGDSVTIRGAEMTMGDLFEYVDIDMPVSAENVMVGELPDNVTMERVEGNAPDESTAGVSLLSARTAGASQLRAGTAEASQLSAGTDAAWWLTPFSGEAHIPFNLRFSVGLSGVFGDSSLNSAVDAKGKISINGKATYTLKQVDAVLHYMDSEALLFIGGAVHSDSSWNVNVTGAGSGSLNQVIAPVKVPISAFPLLSVEGNLSLTISLSGSITGGISSSQSATDGFAFGVTLRNGFSFEKIDNKSDPSPVLNLEELSGTLSVGPTVDLGIGTWGIAKISGSVFGGVEFKGSYDPFETPLSEEEFIHDCDVCIDGSIDFLVRVQAAAAIKLKNLKQNSLVVTLPEVRQDFKDFYLSFGRTGIGKPEFGWDKCPYKRYRAEITVRSEDGAVGGANVSAAFPDGRTEETSADDSGLAVLFLPSGTSTVRASHQGMSGSTDVSVSSKPVTATVTISDERQIFIICHYVHTSGTTGETMYGDVGQWPFITERYHALYPNAIFLTQNEWTSTETPLETYGISPGDIIVWLFSGSNDYETQYHVDGTPYAYRITTPFRLSQNVNMVVLPTAEDVENGVRPDEPFVLGLSQHNIFMVYYPAWPMYPTTYLNEITFDEDEDYYLGCLYDEDFRLTQMGEWRFRNSRYPYWQGSALIEDILSNTMPHSEAMADCIFAKATADIDALWNNRWEELTEALTGSDDIVVSETPAQ